jgi:hypothetical protein
MSPSAYCQARQAADRPSSSHRARQLQPADVAGQHLERGFIDGVNLEDMAVSDANEQGRAVCSR